MARSLRSDTAGTIYHALNRGNARRDIFFKDEDYEAFERVVSEAMEKYPVDLISYQWMKNHWHMVLCPRENKAMSAVSWLGDHDPHAALPRSLQNYGIWPCLPRTIQKFSGSG